MISPASSIVMSPADFSAPTLAESEHSLMKWLHKGLPAEFCTGERVFHPNDFPNVNPENPVISSSRSGTTTPGSPMSMSSSVSSLSSTADRSPTHMAEISIIPKGEYNQSPNEICVTRVLPVYAPIIFEGKERKGDGKSVCRLRQLDVEIETVNLRYHALEFLDDKEDGVQGMKLPQNGAILIKLWEIQPGSKLEQRKIVPGVTVKNRAPEVELQYQFSLQKMAVGSTSVIRGFTFVPPAYVVSIAEPARPALWAVMQAGVAKGSIRTQADVQANGRPNRPEAYFSGHGLKIMFGVREQGRGKQVSSLPNNSLPTRLIYDHAHERSPVGMIDVLDMWKASELTFAQRDWAIDSVRAPDAKDELKLQFVNDILEAESMKQNPHNPEKWILADLKKQNPDGADLMVRRVLILYLSKDKKAHFFKTKAQLEAAEKAAQSKRSDSDDDSDSDSESDDEEEEEEEEELEGEQLEAALSKAVAKLSAEINKGKCDMTAFAPSRPFKAVYKANKSQVPAPISAPQYGGPFYPMGQPNGMITPPNGPQFLPFSLPTPPYYGGGHPALYPGMQLPGAPQMPRHTPGFGPGMKPFAPAPAMPNVPFVPPGYGITWTQEGHPVYVPLSNLPSQGSPPNGRRGGENASDSGRSSTGGPRGAPAKGAPQRDRRNSNPRGANGGNGDSRGSQQHKRQNPSPQGPRKKGSQQFKPVRRTATAPADTQEGWSQSVPPKAKRPQQVPKNESRYHQIRKVRSWREPKELEAKAAARNAVTDSSEDDSDDDEVEIGEE